MITKDEVGRVHGGTVVDADGGKIGSVGEVFLDDRTGEPEWVTVSTGLFGKSQTFVPLAEATLDGENLRVPFDKDKVKDAPKVEADQHLDVEQERELYRYYGLDYNGGGQAGTVGQDTGNEAGRETNADDSSRTEQSGVVGHDTSGPTTDNAMTISEEQLKVGTEKQEVGRARLRKHVVTEQQNVTVPVQREEVRVEREPITDANRGQALDGPAISEEEHEVVLHQEQPVVEKEAVPVERVRLGKETVTGQEQVSEEVRKERVETDDADIDNHNH